MRLAFKAAVFFEKLMREEVRFTHRLLDKAENTDKAGIAAMKNEAFLALVKQVFENSAYYREFMLSHGYDLNTFRDISDINKFPVLTKDIIKEQTASLLCGNIDPLTCITRTSGGTTGEPMRVEVNRQAAINDLYFYYRGLHWMGYTVGNPMVKFFGGSLGGNNSPTLKNKIKKLVSNELFLPAFSLQKENASQYLDIIKAKGKTHLQGYASSMYSLAVYAKELNYKGLKIAGVFTTAEQLPADQAAFICEVFGCDVKGVFGSGEINSLGFQTKMGGNYVVPDEIMHYETIKHPKNGVDNSFLISSLYNYRTPLLRYLNGDAGKIVQGVKYTEIEELSGRIQDMFIKKDGTIISSMLASQTMQVSGLTHKIKLYQFIQNDIGKIEFRYQVFKEPLTNDEYNHLLKIFSDRLGQEFTIEPICTDEFIKSANGKHRLMINRVIT